MTKRIIVDPITRIEGKKEEKGRVREKREKKEKR